MRNNRDKKNKGTNIDPKIGGMAVGGAALGAGGVMAAEALSVEKNSEEISDDEAKMSQIHEDIAENVSPTMSEATQHPPFEELTEDNSAMQSSEDYITKKIVASVDPDEYQPDPIDPEPINIDPEPVDPVTIEPDPIEPEPEPIEPEPINPEPINLEPEPINIEPEPEPIPDDPIMPCIYGGPVDPVPDINPEWIEDPDIFLISPDSPDLYSDSGDPDSIAPDSVIDIDPSDLII